MIEALKRNAVILAGLLLAGAVCVMASWWLASPRGALGPTVLQAKSPVAAGLAVVLCFAGATAIAGGVARLINPVVGMFVLGAGLFMLAGRTETVHELAFGGSPPGGRWRLAALAIETAGWAGLVLAAAVAVFKAPVVGKRDAGADDDQVMPIWTTESLKLAATGAAALLAVWLLAKSPMKGQMIGATFIGGMVTGLLGRLVARPSEPIVLFAAPIVFGAIGHLVGMMALGSALDSAFVLRQLSVFGLPMPIDYAAGSLMGVAVGWGWAQSFHQHHEHETAPRGASAIP